MSWLRAWASAVVIVVVTIALLAYLPNMALTRLHSSRSVRVFICVVVFNVALVALLVALRRLQARRVI